MKQLWRLLGLACVLGPAWLAPADIIVNYGLDGGGTNQDPLNGLAARATFALAGTHLSVLLEDTSTGVPASFDTADSLLVSVGLNLPGGVYIVGGNSAVIGPGSHGLGSWSSRVAGDSVAEQWLWTNDFGGDLMEAYAQVISTSSGQGGGTVTRFDGQNGTVGGPFGGIAADPPWRSIPDNQPAVGDSILFELTLSDTLSAAQLGAAANASIVEYGSDARYLLVPEPAGLLLAALGLCASRARRSFSRA
jgi:hypothetical protein